MEQCRTTAKLFTGSSRRFRPLSHAGFRSGKPLCPHKSRQPLGCQRYADRTVHDHSRGQSDSNIRRIFTTGWQSQWQAALESQLLAVSPKARLISVDYGKDPKNYQAAPIKMTFRYEIPGYALSGEGEMLFKPMVMNNLYNQVKSYLRINTDLEERRYGFKDACSRLVELDETIQLPTGYKLAVMEKKTVRKFCRRLRRFPPPGR